MPKKPKTIDARPKADGIEVMMTEAQIQAVLRVARSVGGSYGGPRGDIASLYDALTAAGYEPSPVRTTGSIYFPDNNGGFG